MSEEAARRYSVACRDVPGRDGALAFTGHGGRYGQPGDLCPHCAKPMTITGAWEVTDLSVGPSVTESEKAMTEQAGRSDVR